MIVATAGHIDHGKTSLVKMLTGIDTDRLPEEKARGMSIDLGFAYVANPDGSVLGFIDVPGHERFIKNMLAGVMGIDTAMLVVAADDGPMPQTIEHLAILDMLGVSSGVVAITKIDRVDPGRVAQVTASIATLLAGTSFAGAPVVPVSSLTGAGITDLRHQLEISARPILDRRSLGNFRLAIDRQFNVAGVGLIVTGTVFSGKVEVGESLVVSPNGTKVRVRGIHAQNQESTMGTVGQRCALNLTGTDSRRIDVKRGDWLLTETIHAPTSRFDARIRILRSERLALKHWTPVHVHLGAAEMTGRVAILEGSSISPDSDGLVQIVLDQNTSVLRGDAFILRDQSARRTVAGGRAIDPFPPSRGRSRPDRLAFDQAMEVSSPEDSLARLLTLREDGVNLQRFSVSWNLNSTERAKLWADSTMVRSGPPASATGFSSVHWRRLLDATTANLEDWHRTNPDQAGPTADILRRRLPVKLSQADFDAILSALVQAGDFVTAGPRYCRAGFAPRMLPKDAALWSRIKPLLEKDPLQPPVVAEMSSRLNVDHKELERFLVRCMRLNFVCQVAKNRFLLPNSLRELEKFAKDLDSESGQDGFTASAFRDRSCIGRNFTIEILEYFDRIGLTWRVGDTRRIRNALDRSSSDTAAS